jgi:hypothetical protein
VTRNGFVWSERTFGTNLYLEQHENQAKPKKGVQTPAARAGRT